MDDDALLVLVLYADDDDVCWCCVERLDLRIIIGGGAGLSGLSI